MGFIATLVIIVLVAGISIKIKKIYEKGQKSGCGVRSGDVEMMLAIAFFAILLLGYYFGTIDRRKDSIELASPGEVFELSMKMGNKVIVANEDGEVVKYAFQKNTVINADGTIRINN